MVEPGLDSAVALLGILKAGAVYVPLDPSYPSAARAILDDTRPAGADAAAHAGRLAGSRDVALDAAHPSDEPAVLRDRPAPTDRAYILHVGHDRAAEGRDGEHANLAHYLQVALDRYAHAAPT